MSDREGTTNLWIANSDGSKVRRLNRTPAVCYMPSWQKTPRGERIVFGKHGDKPEMASIKPDGSGEEILGEGHDPTLSPDGKLIPYTGHEGGGVTVFVMSLPSGESVGSWPSPRISSPLPSGLMLAISGLSPCLPKTMRSPRGVFCQLGM